EIELGLARDDSREMEDHVGTAGDQLFGRAGNSEIAGLHLDGKAWLLRLCGRDDVVQRHLRDVGLTEPSVAEQALDQFAADHAGRAQNQYVQAANSLLFR